MNSSAETARPRRGVNLSRIDFVSMHLLLQCASRGSLSSAAADCHLSVMAASERLRRLEDTLGKRLFHRYRHGLEITDAGRVASRWATMMLEGLQNLVLEVAAAPDSSPKQGVNSGRRGRRRVQECVSSEAQ